MITSKDFNGRIIYWIFIFCCIFIFWEFFRDSVEGFGIFLDIIERYGV